MGDVHGARMTKFKSHIVLANVIFSGSVFQLFTINLVFVAFTIYNKCSNKEILIATTMFSKC